MIETSLAAIIALITGAAAITNRLHRRIDEVHVKIAETNRRVDSAELSMARQYVFKTDFDTSFHKMENHMVRIEEKIDTLMMNRRHGDNHG